VLSTELSNAQETQIETRALELEAHGQNMEWRMVRIPLERYCICALWRGARYVLSHFEWRSCRADIDLSQGN
jgi:hypothetical protein